MRCPKNNRVRPKKSIRFKDAKPFIIPTNNPIYNWLSN